MNNSVNTLAFIDRAEKLFSDNDITSYARAESLIKHWRRLVATAHLHVAHEGIRQNLTYVLGVGARVCERTLATGSLTEAKQQELSYWHHSLLLDEATHRLQSGKRLEVASARDSLDVITSELPAVSQIDGRLTELALENSQLRLSALALTAYGGTIGSKWNGTDSEAQKREGLAKTMDESIAHMTALQEYANRMPTNSPEQKMALNGIFRAMHFSNLLARWHVAPEGEERLIRFGLYREINPISFNVVVIKPGNALPLRCKLSPGYKAEKLAPGVLAMYAKPEIIPIADTMPAVRKALRRMIDATKSSKGVEIELRKLDNFLGAY